VIEDISWSGSPPSSSISTTNKKARILIVDDDPEITESFGLVLEDSGLFHVEKYTEPVQALSNLKPDSHDLVLLDVNLPNVDSFELYDKMKKIDSKLKVFFLVIYDNEESYQALRKEFRSLDAECFMPKEVLIKDLIGRINRILST
jgi:PleD family two-component response regulator